MKVLIILCLSLCLVACDPHTGPSDIEFSEHEVNNLIDITVKTKTNRQGLEINLLFTNIAGFKLYPQVDSLSSLTFRVTDYYNDLCPPYYDWHFENQYWSQGLDKGFSYATTYIIPVSELPAEVKRGKVYVRINLTNYGRGSFPPTEISVPFNFNY